MGVEILNRSKLFKERFSLSIVTFMIGPDILLLDVSTLLYYI
jgi:hypothetical protein